MTDSTPSSRRAVRVLGAVFLLYAALVAPNLGEFWPFSIFPMFSQGAQPWTNALVRDVSDAPPADWAAVTARGDLPGDPFGLAAHGVNKLDVSKMVDKTEQWTDDRVAALQAVLAPALDADRRLLVVRTRGRLENDSVATRFEPLVLVAADTAAINPSLPR